MTDLVKAAIRWVMIEPTHKRVNLRQIAILGVMADEGLTRVRDISTRLNLFRPVVSRNLSNMFELGLVSRQVDPEDRRDVIFLVSKQGIKTRNRMRDQDD